MKPVNPREVVVRATASHKGRKLSVTPADSPMKRLHYGRILLDQTAPKVVFETCGREVGLLCMAGQCVVQVNGGDTIGLGHYDALYVPRGSTVQVSTGSSVDLVEVGAEVDGNYPLQVVRYRDVEQNPALKFTAGGDATKRELNILIGKNVDAGRIVAGFTRSAPGHWTSWPPHEHTEILEEMYVYFDMPPPAFGVQLVYTTPETPEVVAVVRDGDAVLMPAGYHPNVAAPGHSINFVWLMAAHREREDRVFGVVNVQPEFSQRGSGLEASLK